MIKLEYLLLLLVLFASTIVRNEAIDGWTPIKNLNDLHVKEIANFAVTEYNKRSKAKLKLLHIIKGDSEVVAGILYRLVLTAGDDSSSNNYEAIVWEKLWLHWRNLTSFTPIHA